MIDNPRDSDGSYEPFKPISPLDFLEAHLNHNDNQLLNSVIQTIAQELISRGYVTGQRESRLQKSTADNPIELIQGLLLISDLITESFIILDTILITKPDFASNFQTSPKLNGEHVRKNIISRLMSLRESITSLIIERIKDPFNTGRSGYIDDIRVLCLCINDLEKTLDMSDNPKSREENRIKVISIYQQASSRVLNIENVLPDPQSGYTEMYINTRYYPEMIQGIQRLIDLHTLSLHP